MFILVPAHPRSQGERAVKRLLFSEHLTLILLGCMIASKLSAPQWYINRVESCATYDHYASHCTVDCG